MQTMKESERVFDNLCKINGYALMNSLQDISKGELAILAYLTFRQDGVSAGELAKFFELGTSRIAAILNTLSKKKMAKREKDVDDGRRVLVFVTENGRTISIQKREQVLSHLSLFLKELGTEDTEQLIRILEKSLRILDYLPNISQCEEKKEG